MVVGNNSTALLRPRLQALRRAVEKSLTPHSWEIFWTPETAKVQLGGDNRGATRHAQVAMSDCLQDSGVEESVALEISGDAVGNTTVVDHSDHSGSWSAGAAEVQGGWTSTTDAIEYADDTHVVAANAAVTGCVGRAAEAVADYESAFATGGVKGGTCLQWLLTDGTSFFGRCSPRRVLWGVNVLMLLYAVALTAGVAPRSLQINSAPVISDVSPKQLVMPIGSILSMKLPTVGFEPIPEVVSDSPHLTETQSSLISHCSR